MTEGGPEVAEDAVTTLYESLTEKVLTQSGARTRSEQLRGERGGADELR